MKLNSKFILATLAATLLAGVPVFADTVITAPIDSRPISCEYLNDLAALSGDEVIYPEKSELDFFTNDESLNRFADSKKVRESIYEMTGSNNKEQNTVIINTSTYFTGGLVGSRVGSNYGDLKSGLEDLRKLATDYDKPYYYVNLTTPRALPETRFNSIWRNEDTIYGIGYYYLQRNPNCEDADYIKANYSKITPAQLLMEYSYVSGKKSEGVPLQSWETDFYRAVNSKYMSKDPYRTYLNNYTQPFEKSVELFKGLLELKNEGLIDEIVISTDDLQLPNSISYFYSQKASWVQSQNGSAVKYSFARLFFETGTTSIMKQIDQTEGKQERYKTMLGKGNDINVIYGTDEVPQLIYARELSRKKGLKASFNIIYNSTSKTVAAYDVSNVQKLTNAACDFVGANRTPTSKQTDLYIYSYAASSKTSDTVAKIKNSIVKGKNAALIELYDSKTLNSSNNELFKSLVKGKSVSIADLSAYSAWNTNGNAIGLGVAQAQVFAINEQTTGAPVKLAKAQKELLLRHAIEDGVYTVQTKRLLSNARYMPTKEELEESAKLRETLAYQDVLNAFENSTITLSDREYTVKKATLDKCGFPWARTFDCYLDVSCEVERKNK
jgi:hypothetical protein